MYCLAVSAMFLLPDFSDVDQFCRRSRHYSWIAGLRSAPLKNEFRAVGPELILESRAGQSSITDNDPRVGDSDQRRIRFDIRHLGGQLTSADPIFDLRRLQQSRHPIASRPRMG